NYFGHAVSSAGDINKDGYSDLIIGAYGLPQNGKVFLYSEDTPIAIKLSSFTAVIEDGTVHLHWCNENETNHAGFNVWRSSHANQDFVKINLDFVQGKHHGSGADYDFFDTPEAPGIYYYKLEDINLDGVFSFSNIIHIDWITTAVNDETPLTFQLHQNYPNPFNTQTTIRYELPQAVHVLLTILDTRGRIICRLVNQNQPAGAYTVVWCGKDDAGKETASGLYFCQLRAVDLHCVHKMTLLK
ncbi:FG-GAP repeat protein, partial [candidate division KSB1 bacterium]|nr:FG-GAP repeat protein [candidate division KSB1 bacterium]